MNTPFTYVLKIQMFGYSQIIACSVIIGTACITGHQFPTAMIGMRGGIVQTKDYLRSPLLPPPFFPKAQTRTESPVLIPGLAEAVKKNLDSIQEKGMLETVKAIL